MTVFSAWVVAALAIPGAALAQDEPPYPYPVRGIYLDDPYEDDGVRMVVRGNEDHLVTDMGVALMLGGGMISRVSDRSDGNPTLPGGAWHVRLVIGTRSFIAGELAYVGSAAHVQPEVADAYDVMLLSTGGEAALRAQIPVPVGIREDAFVAPFATVGAGVQVQDLMNEELELLGDRMIGNDPTFHLPVSAGLALGSEGFIADARVGYRPAVVNDRRVFGEASAFDNAIDELVVTGSLGVEF